MNKISLIVFFSITLVFKIHSQESKAKTTTVHYIPLKDYKKKHNTSFNEINSSLIKFIDNDTLVKLKEYQAPKGTSVPYEFKDSIFLNHYKKVAFFHKNDSIDKKTTMKYWKDDIRIYFSKSIQSKTKRIFLKFTQEISKNVDSINIYEVKKVEDSNYIIYYEGDFEYESRMSNYKNTDYYMHWKNGSKIYKCTLRIDSDKNYNEALKLYDMKRYFFGSLGRFKTSNNYKCYSYFSNCYSDKKRITDFDLELLKYHYSYGICKGTSLETFEEQHKKAKEILKKTHKNMFFFHPYN